MPLNEGRGMNPGDTLRRLGGAKDSAALNEGRGMNPGDTSRPSQSRDRQPPLNEGRGMNPGDTDSEARVLALMHDAQRRPGDEPRRHYGV